MALLVATVSLQAQQVRELPPGPPRMLVEGTPGAEYSLAVFEFKQVKVKPIVTPDLHKAIDEAKLPQLLKLHSAARAAREKAVKAEDAAELVSKARNRAKTELTAAEKAYDKASRPQKPAKKRILDKAKGDFEDAERISNRRAGEAKEAIEAYDAVLNSYMEAWESAKPAIEAFKKAAGVP
ncbi:MAG: hypothetical protein ACKO4N_09615 [Verrucomicrobiota bacterium]